jgi:AAA domain
VSADASSWRPIDLVGIEPFEPRRPDLAAILYPQLRHLLTGEPESGKSMLGRAIALDVLRADRSVVWVDFESDAWAMEEQLRCFGATDAELRRLAYLNPNEPIGTAGATDAIAATVKHYQPVLVVVDAFVGLLDLHDLDGHKSADVERAYRALIGPWRTDGAAVLVIDHVVKARDARSRFAAGSERKLGAVDVHIGLEPVHPFGRGRTGRSKIIVHKDRQGFLLPRPRLGDFVLASDADGENITWTIDPVAGDEAADTDTPFRPTELMGRVSTFLQRKGESASRSEIERGVNGRAKWVRVAMDRLLDEGYVTEQERPRGARLLCHARPFTSSASDPVPTPSGTNGSHPVPRPGSLDPDADEVDQDELDRLAAIAAEMGLE